MGYLGTPIDTNNTFQSLQGKRFSGNGSTTAFTLDIAPTSVFDIEVFVENVRQDPNSAYSLNGTTLTFGAAPASGTNNIYVVHQAKAVGTISPTSDSVVASSIADEAIESEHLNNNIISGQTALGAAPASGTNNIYVIHQAKAVGTIDVPASGVVPASLASNIISGQTALTSEPADTDEFLVSDAGTIKRLDYSLIKASNTPAFKAFHNTTQTVANTTLTTLSFNSETFDSDGKFDTSNGRFTPGVAGKYVLFANIRPNHTNVYQLEIEIRTSVENSIAKCGRGNSAGDGDSFFVYTIADLSSDEYAFVTSYHSQGTTRTMLGGQSEAFFGGFRIIGA